MSAGGFLRRAAMALLVGLAAAPSSANDHPYTVVPEAFVYCTTCHGVELKGNRSVDAPRLNGMERWYVGQQLRAFKLGLRGTHPEDLVGMEMRPQATVLTDDAIEQAADFVATVPVRTDTSEHTVEGDAGRGAALYATCAACHGNEGQGNRELNAPRLAGQSDWYLVRALESFLAGRRGYDPGDTAGTQMRIATGVLSGPGAVRDVVAYINTLPSQ